MLNPVIICLRQSCFIFPVFFAALLSTSFHPGTQRTTSHASVYTPCPPALEATAACGFSVRAHRGQAVRVGPGVCRWVLWACPAPGAPGEVQVQELPHGLNFNSFL